MAAPPPHRIRVVCRLRPADDAAEVRGASLIVPKNRACASRGTSYQHKVGCGLASMPLTTRAPSVRF